MRCPSGFGYRPGGYGRMAPQSDLGLPEESYGPGIFPVLPAFTPSDLPRQERQLKRLRRRARRLKRQGFGNKAIARKLGMSEAHAQRFTQGMPPGRNRP